MNEYDTVKSLFPGPLNDQGKEDLVDAFESGLTLSCISSIEDPEDNPTYESFSAQLLRFHQNQKIQKNPKQTLTLLKCTVAKSSITLRRSVIHY